jgi:uncharacterized protein with HEPN domain
MKLTKAKAQDQIVASAHTSSARLLALETLCFSQMRAEFKARIPEITHKTVAGIRNNHDLREAWVDAHTLAMVACTDHVSRLAEDSAAAADEAIRAELLLCERALPARHAGTVERLAFRSDRIVAAAVEGWQGGMAGQRAEYRRAQTHRLSRDKTVEELTQHLFADGGAWWQALPAAEQWARWVSIRVSNKVRAAAMKAFNDAA